MEHVKRTEKKLNSVESRLTECLLTDGINIDKNMGNNSQVTYALLYCSVG